MPNKCQAFCKDFEFTSENSGTIEVGDRFNYHSVEDFPLIDYQDSSSLEYAQNLDCTWIIMPGNSRMPYKIDLQIGELILAKGDELKVYDKSTDQNRLLFTGTSRTPGKCKSVRKKLGYPI